ncbi:MAG: immunity protein 12 [[Eubacterium] sulci]|nr:immunity protein 12 [[Eubacterium] sulci]
MKVNMNVIVGGTDDVLDNILSAARTVRKELKASFESIEIEALQKMDICVCFSGNVSKYYPESGIYQARYYSKTKKFIVYVHFSSNEWNSNEKENVSKFIKLYNDYLLQLSDIIKMKMAKSKLGFDNKSYEDIVKRAFENLYGSKL